MFNQGMRVVKTLIVCLYKYVIFYEERIQIYKIKTTCKLYPSFSCFYVHNYQLMKILVKVFTPV